MEHASSAKYSFFRDDEAHGQVGEQQNAQGNVLTVDSGAAKCVECL